VLKELYAPLGVGTARRLGDLRNAGVHKLPSQEVIIVGADSKAGILVKNRLNLWRKRLTAPNLAKEEAVAVPGYQCYEVLTSAVFLNKLPTNETTVRHKGGEYVYPNY